MEESRISTTRILYEVMDGKKIQKSRSWEHECFPKGFRMLPNIGSFVHMALDHKRVLSLMTKEDSMSVKWMG